MRRLALLALLVPLAGCASLAPAPVPAPVPASKPVPTVEPATRTPPRTAPGPRAWMPADSLPTAEALAVLARIPEPIAGSVAPEGIAGTLPRETQLPGSQPPVATSPPPRPAVPPPPATPVTAPAPADAFDSLRVAPPPPTDEGLPPPTPVPTPALGDRPSVPPDSGRSDGPARAAPPGEGTPPRPSSPAAPGPGAPPAPSAERDTCWRVQFAAPSERVRAEAVRDAVQSVLVTPVTIELEASRWKVRSKVCLARPAAEALRQRALDSGFPGVFLVRREPVR